MDIAVKIREKLLLGTIDTTLLSDFLQQVAPSTVYDLTGAWIIHDPLSRTSYISMGLSKRIAPKQIKLDCPGFYVLISLDNSDVVVGIDFIEAADKCIST